MSKRKKPQRARQPAGASRERPDVISLSLPIDSIAELDAAVAELDRREGVQGKHTRSSTVRHAIALLHDQLLWRHPIAEETEPEDTQ